MYAAFVVVARISPFVVWPWTVDTGSERPLRNCSAVYFQPLTTNYLVTFANKSHIYVRLSFPSPFSVCRRRLTPEENGRSSKSLWLAKGWLSVGRLFSGAVAHLSQSVAMHRDRCSSLLMTTEAAATERRFCELPYTVKSFAAERC